MVTPIMNMPISATVISIHEAAESFNNSKGVKMYCHKCVMTHDGHEVRAQLCSEMNKLDYFSIMDDIEVTLTNFNGGKEYPYTMKFMRVLTHKGEEVKVADPGTTVDATNKMVSGTIADRALGHAVALYSNEKKITPELINTVINTAYIFQDYFRNNL